MHYQELHHIVENMEKAIFGKRQTIEFLLMALLCQGHVLIEDVPGVGKTSMVAALAKSVDCSFKRIQFTPDLMPSDITGFSIYNQKTGDFDFRMGQVSASFVLADEINRASPKTQSALLEAMEEAQVTVDGVTHKLPEPFMVLATQNPIEYVGTYPLPEAQIDRFLMCISMGYPEKAEEAAILKNYQGTNPLKALQAVVNGAAITALQAKVNEIFVDDLVHQYIVDLATYTRNHAAAALGVSPRGSLSLCRAAQACALYNNRSYVLPDDIKLLAVPVLAHRVILKQEARLGDITAQAIVEEALTRVAAPIAKL
ncbi:MAG: MoxR family ATPase [Oscillospiraceae bacterium]|nr:MoxR family ATPase [Oscillospiraceae bacterium]